jgi:hypothetical protein
LVTKLIVGQDYFQVSGFRRQVSGNLLEGWQAVRLAGSKASSLLAFWLPGFQASQQVSCF